MAQYKVPQDVEAEDKFIGPLTFKQFLFAMATMVTGYLSFLVLTSPLPWLVILFLPFFLISLVFTIPWSKDQPTDLFLASRIRFLFMKRKRIWDQSGMKDLVTITVPKREVHYYTDGLTQEEVKSRFAALSNVVDSRGWAVKNAARPDDSDRLVAPSPRQESPEEINAKRTPDILEERSSQVDELIQRSENEHRKEALDLVAQAKTSDTTKQGSRRNGADTLTGSISLPPVSPQHASMKASPKVKSTLTAADEKKLLDKLHKEQEAQKKIRLSSHEKRIPTQAEREAEAKRKAEEEAEAARRKSEAQSASATPVNPAILMASQNDDRSISSFQREMSHQEPDDSGEVVVPLH